MGILPPPFSDQLTQHDLVEMQQYKDVLDASHNAPVTLQVPSDKYAAIHSGQMNELSPHEPSSKPIPLALDIIEHLKDRYGFDAHHQLSHLHDIPVKDIITAKRHFLFESADHS